MDRELRLRERRILQSPHEDDSLKQLARQYRRSGQWFQAYKIYSQLGFLDNDSEEVQSLVSEMRKQQRAALAQPPRHWRAFPRWAFSKSYSQDIEQIQSAGQLLEGVEIPGPIDETDFQALLTIPYLSSLRLRESHWFSANLSSLKEAKNLEELSVAFINARHAPLRGLEELQGLKNLELSCRNLNAPLLEAIASLKSLQKLTLKVTRGSLQSLTQLKNSGLRHLTLETKHFQGSDSSFLSELSILKELSLEGDLTEKEFDTLCQSKSLEALSLSRIGRKTILNSYDSLGRMTQLKELSLFLCGIRSEQCQFFEHLQELKELTITKNPNINSAVLPHIAQLKALRGLDLFRTAVSNENLESLCQLVHLQYLFLSSTHVTRQGLKPLQQLPALRELFLDHNYSSEDGSLTELFKELN